MPNAKYVLKPQPNKACGGIRLRHIPWGIICAEASLEMTVRKPRLNALDQKDCVATVIVPLKKASKKLRRSLMMSSSSLKRKRPPI